MNAINPLDYPVCLVQPLNSQVVSTWIEHVPFGMFMIDILRPKVFVELGANRGCSYLAFCQTVKELGLDTRCYAVDTWKGDDHTGAYSENVLANLRTYHDPLYGEFSRLVQSTFDDVLDYFPDGSIDLLHIDGFHTYEAVKHDFETWLPKLSKHAVVLFHDTNVHEKDFGVWKLWEELQPRYPHFEFLHGYGLGVLRIESEPSSALESLFVMTNEQSERLRTFFFTLGSRLSTAAQYEKMIAQKEQNIKTLNAQGEEKKRKIAMLQREKDAAIAEVLAQKAALENEMRDMLNGKAWKLVLILRKIRYWLMPVRKG